MTTFEIIGTTNCFCLLLVVLYYLISGKSFLQIILTSLGNVLSFQITVTNQPFTVYIWCNFNTQILTEKATSSSPWSILKLIYFSPGWGVRGCGGPTSPLLPPQTSRSDYKARSRAELTSSLWRFSGTALNMYKLVGDEKTRVCSKL